MFLDTYAELKNKMRLDIEALLTYMVRIDRMHVNLNFIENIQAIRVIGTSKNDVHINLKSPAQIKYEL